MMRRLGDVTGALAGLLVFAPVFAVVAVAVKLDDGGPVMFRQPRTGYRRRPFTILKFRTMKAGAVTRAGRLLRSTGLDEIPQLINILRGDMSAVGPRPLTDADIQRYGWLGPSFDFRWDTKPGLTGIAQLAGAATPAEALALDRAYAMRRNAWTDIQCIALSFAVNALGKSRVRGWLRSARVGNPRSSRP